MENHQLKEKAEKGQTCVNKNPVIYINATSGNIEYFTPSFIIEAARNVMSGIDLDPASCEKANKIVKATRFYTKDDDGLNQEWTNRVWMNHPFGIAEKACDPVTTGKVCNKKLCQKRGWHQKKDYPGNAGWIKKFITQYLCGSVTEALCICFASTSESWFQPLFEYPQCFLSPRTNYVDENGKVVQGVSKGSVVTYLGNNFNKFKSEFKSLGAIK